MSPITQLGSALSLSTSIQLSTFANDSASGDAQSTRDVIHYDCDARSHQIRWDQALELLLTCCVPHADLDGLVPFIDVLHDEIHSDSGLLSDRPYRDLRIEAIVHQSTNHTRLSYRLVSQEDHLDLLRFLCFVGSPTFSLHVCLGFKLSWVISSV